MAMRLARRLPPPPVPAGGHKRLVLQKPRGLRPEDALCRASSRPSTYLQQRKPTTPDSMPEKAGPLVSHNGPSRYLRPGGQTPGASRVSDEDNVWEPIAGSGARASRTNSSMSSEPYENALGTNGSAGRSPPLRDAIGKERCMNASPCLQTETSNDRKLDAASGRASSR